MERRKLLLHIDQEDDDDDTSGSSVSKLLIECPRVVYTAFCFIIFLTTCLFLLVMFVILLLLNDNVKHDNVKHVDKNTIGPNKEHASTTVKPITTTMYRSKQSMFEYLRGLHRNKNKTNSKDSKHWKNKNLSETCFDMIQNDDEFNFNNLTKNNIFFTKLINEVIDEKSACCIESTLYLNPYKTVFLLNLVAEDLNIITENEAKETSNQNHVAYLKSFYKNLKVKDINMASYFRNTPFENFDKAHKDTNLMIAMTKLITLWKYTGLVNSRQNLLLSKNFYNQSTILLDKSIFYSSYSQICSSVIEKLLLSFKTRANEPYETVDQVLDSAIDNMTNNCDQCDVMKMTQFQVCTVLKPSCYFVNIDSVWRSPKVNTSTYCPKVYDLISSKIKEVGGNEKKPPPVILL